MQTLKIGNVFLNNSYILAPMAGVTDLPFRLICKDFGAGLTTTEMVSAKAITYKNKKTFDLLMTGENEHPVAVQLFGSEPDTMAEAVKMIEEYPFDIIDINMGCPVLKVVKNGEGSALSKNPVLAGKIIEAMAKVTKKPVTVKFRLGFEKNKINAVEMAKISESSGASAITIHGRTREQFYEGEANWEEIAKVKESVNIPVIGNGDLFNYDSAMRMKDVTGVDGFAVARGAMGNPWIFREMIEYEKSGNTVPKPEIDEICNIILRHGRQLCEIKGEYIGIREMRKHSAWYLSGRRNSSKIRGKLNGINSMEELENLLLLLT